MTAKEMEYAVIYHLLSAISVMCACRVSDIVDRLTGFCWDEGEAECIKDVECK